MPTTKGLTGVKSLTVVGHSNAEALVYPFYFHLNAVGHGVPMHVHQRLLHNPERGMWVLAAPAVPNADSLKKSRREKPGAK